MKQLTQEQIELLQAIAKTKGITLQQLEAKITRNLRENKQADIGGTLQRVLNAINPLRF